MVMPFERMIFQQIQEDAATSVMFRNQALDVLRTTPEQFKQLSEDPAIKRFSQAFAYDTPYSGYTYIGWNQEKRVGGTAEKTIFADPRSSGGSRIEVTSPRPSRRPAVAPGP